MINLAPHATAIIERARLRSHCQSVENRVLLGMTVDEVNALTRFLDGDKPVWVHGLKNSPAHLYIKKWGWLNIINPAGRNKFQITELGQAIRRKLFGKRMGGCGEWESGCNCRMCAEERE